MAQKRNKFVLFWGERESSSEKRIPCLNLEENEGGLCLRLKKKMGIGSESCKGLVFLGTEELIFLSISVKINSQRLQRALCCIGNKYSKFMFFSLKYF